MFVGTCNSCSAEAFILKWQEEELVVKYKEHEQFCENDENTPVSNESREDYNKKPFKVFSI